MPSPGCPVVRPRELGIHQKGSLESLNEKSRCFDLVCLHCRDVPKSVRGDFEAEDETSRSRMSALKDRIRKSGLETYDG